MVRFIGTEPQSQRQGRHLAMWPRRALLAGGISVLALSRSAKAQSALKHGTVIQLDTTPHIWVADWQGVLHWAGDTRALQGRHVDWSKHGYVWLTYLSGPYAKPIGDPWLSLGLLKDGDPIYLPKWETDWPVPKLYHILNIRDVEVFGINERNYGRFVIDRPEWERRYGFNASTLERHSLPSTVPDIFADCHQARVLAIGRRVEFDDGRVRFAFWHSRLPSVPDTDGDGFVLCDG